MSKYDAKIRHMERNLYKGPRSHRGNYLKIGKLKHQSRECHTHSRTQADTHSIQLVLCLSLHQSQRSGLDWKQYALGAAYKCNRKPGALL